MMTIPEEETADHGSGRPSSFAGDDRSLPGVGAIYLVRIETIRIESHAPCPIRILSQLIDTPIIRAFERGQFLSRAARLELERRLWRTLPARARGLRSLTFWKRKVENWLLR